MIPSHYLTKSIIGKKNLTLHSLSQEVKVGTETYYLVEMMDKQNPDNKFYSWENSYVIEKYFQLDQQEFNELLDIGKKVQELSNWPANKVEAVKDIMEKFMKIDVEEPLTHDPNFAENAFLNKISAMEKKQLITEKQNQRFRRHMKKLAKKEKTVDFYVIKGFKKDYQTGQVMFYVKDQMGQTHSKTLGEMKQTNLHQVLHYLQSKIVGFKR